MAKKVNSSYFRFSVVMLVFIAGLMAFFLWRQIKWSYSSNSYATEADNTFSRYAGYGIWMPNNYTVHGIDVSRYQKRVNWSMVGKMKDGDIALKFAFLKATEGSDLLDPQFVRNWKKAKENKLVRGAYHFFREASSGHNQAMYFIKNVKLLTGDLPPVLDIETYSGDNREAFLQEIEVWLRVVEDNYHVTPIIYTNASFYNKYLQDRFPEYPLWVAHYQNRKQPTVDRDWQFWQHNEAGRVNGINGFVDFNVFNGTDSAFRKMLVP